ncbi:MAG: hypothetical protein NTW21_21350, partial [Verrucomicrobia bacterium]|nr:hypothetical protein [Verrucomicrobiota bacterium]
PRGGGAWQFARCGGGGRAWRRQAGLVGQALPVEGGRPGEAGNPVRQDMSDASDKSDASDASDVSDVSDASDASTACRNCQSARWVERPKASNQAEVVSAVGRRLMSAEC